MNFGQALEALKLGTKVSRDGWNGKGMFVVWQKGYPQGIPCNKQTAEAWGMQEGDLFRCEPYLQIQMVNGSHAMWVPSINDVLAEDWGVVEYYCTRNVTSAREHKEREMMRWAKQQLATAHREGWEQCQMECVDIAEEHASNPSVGAVAEKIADAIAAMEYKEKAND